MSQSFFEILGLSVEASYIEIDEAYRRLKTRHSSEPARLREIELAHQTLSNPTARKRHLQELSTAGQDSTTNDNTVPAPSRTSPKQTSPVDRTPTGLAGSDSFVKPGELSPHISSRAQTEFFDVSTQGQSQLRAEQLEDRSRVRQRTEFFDPHEPPRKKASQVGSSAEQISPPERSARQQTEFLDSMDWRQMQSDPSVDDGRTTSAGRSARSRTEFFDSTREVPSAIADGVAPPRIGVGELGIPAPRGSTEMLGENASPHSHDDLSAVSLKVQVSYHNKTAVFALRSGDNLIGRPPRQGAAPAVPLDDPAQFISRHHAVIRVDGQVCAVIDQGSDNGTYLNRRRLQPREPYPLKAEDVITIEGRELRLLVS